MRCVGASSRPRRADGRRDAAGRAPIASSSRARGPCARRVTHHLVRRAGGNDLAARLAAFGAEVDDPVGGADHVEVVLDHEQRMARGEQPLERAEQLRDVVEVQAGRRLVEEEQRAGVSASR